MKFGFKNRQMQKSYKNGWCLNAMGLRGRRLFLLICLSLAGFGISGQAQNSLNVTNYGAKGDAVQIYAKTAGNSSLVQISSPISWPQQSNDTIELFGCGQKQTGTSFNGTVTAYQ